MLPSRIQSVRRTLTVEALEDRTLLNGNVTVLLDPAGVLQITGDSADNQLTIAPSPDSGMIRISGNPDTLTSINGEAFVDFALADITNISMLLLGGQDRVTLTDFSISGGLTVLYDNAADVFALSNFTAASSNFLFVGSSSVIGSGNNSGLLPPLESGNNGGLLPPLS
ncbi:MAG: hypothetical protein L0Z62_26565 [Gemmataceae bacterium]|nr:hypothetical protein [Gemmataceae bacterium]